MASVRLQLRALAAIVLLLIGGARTASAQVGGVILGTVSDASSAAMPGVTMTLRNQETGVARTLVTDENGLYRFSALSPGTYSVRAELSGFAIEERKGIVVTIGLEVRQEFSLKVDSLSELIVVTAATNVVDVSKSEVSGIVTQKQIETLPINTRQYLNLALLMPGTSQDQVRTFYNNVNIGSGLSFYSNGFLADGVSNTWAQQGEPRQDLPQDAIREFKVNTTQYKAEYGLASGGMVTVVTKSGTNNYSGNVFEYFRDKSLNAKNEFEVSKPDFRRNQFGGSLGGPIVRDKTHFFGAIEHTRVEQFFTVNTGRPDLYSSVEGTFPQPRRVTLGSLRLDHSLSPSQSLFVRYSHEDERTICAGSSCGGRISANSGYDMEIPRRAVVAGHTWTLSPRLVNEARVQYATASYQIAPAGTAIFKKKGEYPAERLDRIEQRFSFPSLTYGGNYEALGPESRFQIREVMSWNAPRMMGDHDVKFGVDFSHIPFADDSQVNLKGTYTFGADQYFNPNDPASIANLKNPILFTMTLPPAYVDQPTQHVAFFVQDDWRPSAKLTLNLGVRYDRQFGSYNEDLTPNSFRIPIPFIDNSTRGDKNNFGPRAGFAYDFSGTGSSVLRGGYGLYYDNIRTLQNEYEMLNLVRSEVRISNPSYPDPFNGRDPLDFVTTTPPNLSLLSNTNFKNPYSQQYNLGWTQQIGHDLAVHVDGVYTFVQRDRKTLDTNPVNAATGRRPLPEWGRLDVESSVSRAKYSALYVRLDKRYAQRYQYLISYTLSKSEDNSPGARWVDRNNFEADWGASAGDRRHNLAASGSILLPGDFTLGALLTLRSSLPFNTVAGADLNGDTFATDYVPGTTRNQGARDLDLALINAWRATTGLAPIDASAIRTTKYSSMDLRVSRAFALGTRKLELIGQVFNVLNVDNFAGLQTNARATTFGQASRAAAGTQAELGVRFAF
jgi:outer membrane receptor protein involved in Fe transport